MDEKEQTEYIIHHLAEGDEPKDITFDLCEKLGLSWPQAEALVKKVQQESEGTVALKQFPLLFALALAIFLAGIALLGYSVYLFIYPLLTGQTGNPQAVTNYSLYIVEVVVRSNGLVIYAFIGGLGMVLGSLLGMQETWTRIIENIKQL